jgi:hypothetical protein
MVSPSLAQLALKERRMDRRFEGRRRSVAFGALACAVLLACIGVALGVAALVAASAPSFAAARSYATGPGPVSIAIGDLNGDGKPDLATANGFANNTVSVLVNRGDASFRARRNYGTGRDPESVEIGDLNGDGKGDLVTANYLEGNTVSVLLNRGDGTFQLRRDYATGGGALSVAIGDLNGDGKPDLAAATDFGNTRVSVLLNKGDGSFEARRDYGAGLASKSVAIGDLNGDGSPDLATVNDEVYTLSVLLNRGDGSFEARRDDLAMFPDPYSVSIGDLNRDGRPDLVTANSSKFTGPTVSVLLNRGDGSFRTKVYWTRGGSQHEPNDVAIGDLNGDGRPDLAMGSGTSKVSVLVNRGDGSFQPKLNYRTGRRPESVAVGDLNGDGKQDLATANHAVSTVSVLLNKPGLCTVQDVKRQRLTLPAARRAIVRANCRVGKVRRAYSTATSGRVISQQPGFGAVLPGGGKVDLVVSRGRRPE